MLASIIAVVFGVAALVVYYKGAKPEKPWGKPVLILLVIAAVAAVVLPRTELWNKVTRTRVQRYQAVKLLGEAMKSKLSPGAKVLFIRYQMDPEMMMMDMEPSEDGASITQKEMIEQQLAEVKSAFEKGLGYSVDVLGYEPPALTDSYQESGQSAEAYNEVLKKYSNQDVDVCISMVGLPRGDEGEVQVNDLIIDQMASNMLFGVDVGLQYKPADLKKWINDGIVDAVVLHPSTKSPDRVVITSENLEELPAESPLNATK